jgi:transposase-like protein
MTQRANNSTEMSLDVPKCLAAETHLSEKQRMAIELLLVGHSISDIAAAVDVNRRTVFRWRREEAFCEELHSRREQLWSAAADQLVGLVEPALDVLRRQLGDRHDRSRFRAANAILRLADLRKAISSEQAPRG